MRRFLLPNAACRHLLRATLLLSACSAQPAERPEIASTAGVERERDPCTPPRKAARLYVGFSAGMTLDDFELSAFEAERIAATLLRLCERDEQTADADLRAALATAGLEITAIEFLRDDAGAARVRLQRAAAGGSEAPEAWQLDLTRTPAGWRLLSATPAPAPSER